MVGRMVGTGVRVVGGKVGKGSVWSIGWSVGCPCGRPTPSDPPPYRPYRPWSTDHMDPPPHANFPAPPCAGCFLRAVLTYPGGGPGPFFQEGFFLTPQGGVARPPCRGGADFLALFLYNSYRSLFWAVLGQKSRTFPNSGSVWRIVGGFGPKS